MGSARDYKSWIGETIDVNCKPFQFETAYKALHHTLRGYVTGPNHKSPPNGLICAFSDVEFWTTKYGIFVRGKIIKCEPDCG
jgi:hypothetical protein